MALPFNPFDKKAPQKKYTKVKVYENEPIEQKAVSSDSLENIQTNSREEFVKEPISREYLAPKLENIRRISRDSLEINLYKIVGLQKRILIYIYKICEGIGDKKTPPIAIQNISVEMDITVANAQNAIKEIIKKGYLIRKDFTRGRGAWTVYQVPDEVYKEINNSISRDSLEIHQRFSRDKSILKSRENAPNSSSNDLNNKKELTNQFEIPENLKAIISQRELQKLLEKGLSEENIDLSLKHFAYDFANNLVKSKTGPLNLFFGVVRSGQVYKSIRLLEIENQELRNYQQELEKIEKENNQLKQNEMVKKYQEYIQKNPEYLELIRAEHNNFSLNEEVLSKIAFQKFQDMKFD